MGRSLAMTLLYAPHAHASIRRWPSTSGWANARHKCGSRSTAWRACACWLRRGAMRADGAAPLSADPWEQLRAHLRECTTRTAAQLSVGLTGPSGFATNPARGATPSTAIGSVSRCRATPRQEW